MILAWDSPFNGPMVIELTLAPIWLPHWPACKWTISLMFAGCVGGKEVKLGK